MTISKLNKIFSFEFSILMAYYMNGQAERNIFTVAESYKNNETDSANSVQSSLKSNHLWVTLFILLRLIRLGQL